MDNSLINLYQYRFDMNPNRHIGVGIGMISYKHIGMIILVQLYAKASMQLNTNETSVLRQFYPTLLRVLVFSIHLFS